MSLYSLKSKLPQVGNSIFSMMSALAAEQKAINLSQGFPDFLPDKKLIENVARAMLKGHNQYAPMQGLPALREEIATWMYELYQTTYNPDTEITITSGATEAIFCAIMALVREGDEVVILEPAYESYIPAVELSGGFPVCVELDYPSFKINWDKVKRVINHQTRAIIINTPHNPTGAVIDEEDLLQLEKIIAGNNIYIISDEVYEHIVFDGLKHLSLGSKPSLASRSFIVSSFGKSLHTTGWKVGYCLAPEALSKEFRKIHQFVTFSTSTPFQQAIAGYLKEKRAAIAEVKEIYQAKRDLFLELMSGSRFQPLPCSGTYFQLMNYGNITDEVDTEFAIRLTEQHKVAAIPISVFYRQKKDNKLLRFCFAKEDKTLEKAAEILCKI